MNTAHLSAYQIALHTSPPDWTEEVLQPLDLLHLKCLCALLGVAYSGTKVTMIERLLKLGALRGVLAPFEQVGQLAAAFKGKELHAMCKTAGCWIGPTKTHCAAALLNWRNRCRAEGAKSLAAMQQARQGKLRQLSLFAGQETA